MEETEIDSTASTAAETTVTAETTVLDKVESLTFDAKHFLSRLNEFRLEDKYCDVIVTVEERQFYGHRVVLAANTKYFDAMFGDNFAESDMEEIQLNDVTADGFKILLDYVYTGVVQFRPESINEVLSVASYFSIEPLLDECIAYLTKRNALDVKNVLDVHRLAESLSCDRLKLYTSAFIRERAKLILTTTLSSSVDNDKWSVLKKVIEVNDLNDIVFEMIRFCVKNDEITGKLVPVFDVIGNTDDNSSTDDDSRVTIIKESIYIFDRIRGSEQTDTIRAIRYIEEDWTFEDDQSLDLTLKKKAHIKMVSLKGNPYLYYSENNFNRYDFDSKKWVSLENLIINMKISNMVPSDYDNRIYVNLGGANKIKGQGNVLYYYLVELDKWRLLDIKYNFSGDIISLSNYNCNIFIHSDQKYFTQLDTRDNSFTSKCSAPYQFSSTDTIAVLDEKVYIKGSGNLLMTYDIRADGWLNSIRLPTCYNTNYNDYIVSYQNKIWFVCGLNAHIDIYNPVSNTLETAPSCSESRYKRVGAMVL